MHKLSDLSLNEKIGQMLMCGFQGKEPSEEIIHLIKTEKIGGVIYFNRNIGTPEEVYKLSKGLQERSLQASGVPLFIGMDQEGGMVARITEGVTLMPGNMAFGAVDDADAVFHAAYVTGREMKALGVNMNFAPSVDVNNNPRNPVIGVRSYGDRPDRVSVLGISAVHGYREAGICGTLKHFPGHGDTSTDSHFDLPTIPHNRRRMNQVELVPFKAAIGQGAEVVMTVHVVFETLDESRKPSTLSQEVITELLRNELGFQGVVITDCMEMEAIAKRYGTVEAAVMAVEAGVDVVLVSHSHDRQTRALQAIKNAVESGRISEERINESVSRILKLKQKRKLDQPMPSWHHSRKELGTKQNIEFAREISERSITVIKNEKALLPLDRKKRTFVISPEIRALNAAVEAYKQKETIGYYLTEMIDYLTESKLPIDLSAEDLEHVLSLSRSFEQVVVVTYNTAMFPKQVEMVRRINEERKGDLIVVAVRNPYDFLEFPEVSTQVTSYESRPLALHSTAKVLAGKIPAIGKLPVTL